MVGQPQKKGQSTREIRLSRALSPIVPPTTHPLSRTFRPAITNPERKALSLESFMERRLENDPELKAKKAEKRKSSKVKQEEVRVVHYGSIHHTDFGESQGAQKSIIVCHFSCFEDRWQRVR